jgi:hypothetical protein
MRRNEFLEGLFIFLFILVVFSGLINFSIFNGMVLGGSSSGGAEESPPLEDPEPIGDGSSVTIPSGGGGGPSGSGSGGSSGGFGGSGGLGLIPEGSGSYGANLEGDLGCNPNWACRNLGPCIDGFREKSCVDSNSCKKLDDGPLIISDKCVEVKEECKENLRCSWTKCSDGYTSPKGCIDLNNCGQKLKFPEDLRCNLASNECLPDRSCDPWSRCNIDYSFSNLGNDFFGNVEEGKQSRTCMDNSGCTIRTVEERSCSMEVEVYVKPLSKCNTEYMAIYDGDNKLVARVDKGPEKFNLYFDNGVEGVVCAYCLDGVKNGDETGVDCGGSCKSCEVTYVSLSPLIEESLWKKFLIFFKLSEVF